MFAIGAEGNGIDRLDLTQNLDLRSRIRIPHFDLSICEDGGNDLPVGTELSVLTRQGQKRLPHGRTD